MAEEHVVAFPGWIGLLPFLLCGAFAIIALLIAAVAGFLILRKRGTDAHEVTQLREELARLRDEVDRLKNGQSAPGATGIKEMT